jgi:hypothetical protein
MQTMSNRGISMIKTAAAFLLLLASSGCAVLSVAGTVVSTTASVVGTVVETGVSVAGSAVKGVAKVLSGSDDEKQP